MKDCHGAGFPPLLSWTRKYAKLIAHALGNWLKVEMAAASSLVIDSQPHRQPSEHRSQDVLR